MPSDPEIEVLRQRLDALVNDASKVEAAAARRHVQAAHLLLEEQATDDNLERKAATANGLLPSSFSFATTSDMVDGAPTTRHSSPTSTLRQRRYQTFANW
jgi:hypothetical protein